MTNSQQPIDALAGKLKRILDSRTGEREHRIVAYHEDGHALVTAMLTEVDPLYKVTIMPRGRSLGVTQFRPEDDRRNLPRTCLIERLAVVFLFEGGVDCSRLGERSFIGDTYIRKRRGARRRSLTLIDHGRLSHCCMVSSNRSVVSSAKSADMCWANAVLYTARLIS
jgi:Peptidase family M41